MLWETITYPYRQKIWPGLSAAAFFGVGTGLSVRAALVDGGVLSADSIVRFSYDGSALFDWVMSGLSAAAFALSLFVLITALVKPRTVTLTPDSFVAPRRPLGRRRISIPYAAVRFLDLLGSEDEGFLYVHHAGGKLLLLRTMFQDEASFDEMRSHLSARVSRAQLDARRIERGRDDGLC